MIQYAMASSSFVNQEQQNSLENIDPSTVNMVILWSSTGEMDIYHANMTVNTVKQDEAKPLLDAFRLHGVTIVEMD